MPNNLKIHIFIFLILLLNTHLLRSQQPDSLYITKAYAFINSAIKTDTSTFNLGERPYFGIFSVDTADIFNDSYFNDSDRKSMRAQFKLMDSVLWEADKINGAVVLSQKGIRRSFRHKQGWKHFRKKYGNCLTTYSLPLFSANYDMCVFYTWTQCDYLMGGGNISLYKYENGKWVVVKHYMIGVS